jgi:serine/threonine protein kinase
VRTADAREQIEVALQTLHVKGYVFGDLRCVSVLFDEDKKLKLIDFDWAGPFDMTITDAGLPVELQKKIEDSRKTRADRPAGDYVRYPLDVSKSAPWAQGRFRTTDPTWIRPVHDWEMI